VKLRLFVAPIETIEEPASALQEKRHSGESRYPVILQAA
jgi:hypothetical protein